MKRFKCKRLILAMSFALVSTTALYGVTGMAIVNAELFPNLDRELCMANAYLTKDRNSLPQDALNCTANDVEITEVLNPSLAECTPGDIIVFNADVKVRTNANERYDTTFYLPLTEQSPQNVSVPLTINPNGLDPLYYCSLLLPKASDAGFKTTYADLDLDACADITKKWGSDTYVLEQQSITMLCIDKDNDNQADFHYCAAWDNQERNNCTEDRDPVPGQIPNTKSKCNCDTLNIPIFIKPTPPLISKSLSPDSPSSHSEHGGTFDFTVSFTNPNATSSLYITALTDEIDIDGDGTYDVSLNLWGTPELVDVKTATEGVYLTATTCSQPNADKDPAGEIGPNNLYGCAFSVTVVDRTLSTNPDLYDDVVRLHLVDKNAADVINGESCPLHFSSGPVPVPGQFCSNVEQVSITDLLPTITVEKTVFPTSVEENLLGLPVTYTITVTNTSLVDSVDITNITDILYDDLTVEELAPCWDQTLAAGAHCSFEFTRNVDGNTGDEITNEATVYAKDNEGNEIDDSNDAKVIFTDIPGAISINKSANPLSVPESGGLVTYTVVIENTSPVDTIKITSLEDDKFGNLFDRTGCNFLNNLLAPGDILTCIFEEELSGQPSLDHQNWAKVIAETDDIFPDTVTAMDDAIVTFDDEPADADLFVNISATLFVTIQNNSDYEALNLTKLQLLGDDITTRTVTDGDLNEPVPLFNILNGGGIFNSVGFVSCGQPSTSAPITVAINDSYTCAFTVELLVDENAAINLFSAGGAGLSVQVTDDDGGTPDTDDVTVNVHIN